MGSGRARGHHGVVGTLETEFDRHIAGGEVDEAAGNKKGRNPPRPTFFQDNRRLGDAFDAADAGADHDPGHDLILIACRPPAGIVQRLTGRTQGEGDKFVDLSLLLGFHPLVGVIRAVGAVTARDAAANLGRQVRNVERLDLAGAALTLKEPTPRGFDATTERRDHAQACDDDTSHSDLVAGPASWGHEVRRGSSLWPVSAAAPKPKIAWRRGRIKAARRGAKGNPGSPRSDAAEPAADPLRDAPQLLAFFSRNLT